MGKRPKTQSRLWFSGRRFFERVWCVLAWPFGAGLEVDEDESRNQVSPLVTLFILLNLQLAGVFLGEQGKGVRPLALFLYAMVGFATLCVIAVLNRAWRQREDERIFFLYDRGTKMIGKWIFGSSAVLFTCTIGLGVVGRLPGQAKMPLRITAVEEVSQEDMHRDLPGLALVIPLGPANLRAPFPREHRVLIDLDEVFRTQWYVYQASIQEYTPLGMRVGSAGYADMTLGEYPTEVTVAGLAEGRQCTLVVFLVAHGKQVLSELEAIVSEKDAKKREERNRRFLQQWRKSVLAEGSVGVKLKQ